MKKVVVSLAFAIIVGACGSPSEQPAQSVGPTPTVRVVMVASDPSSFNITAGRPQLVEFFAYW